MLEFGLSPEQLESVGECAEDLLSAIQAFSLTYDQAGRPPLGSEETLRVLCLQARAMRVNALMFLVAAETADQLLARLESEDVSS